MFSALYPEVALPGSEQGAFCLKPGEARHLHDHGIPAYFRHGIELCPGAVVFDVGANIGLFALAALQRCGGDAAVYAFEPIPAIRRVLRLNAARFGPDRLKVFPFGLSWERARLPFSYFPRVPSLSSACAEPADFNGARTRYKRYLLAHVESGEFLPWARRLPRAARAMLVDAVVKWSMQARQVDCEVRTLSEALRDLRVERIDLLKIHVEGAEFDVLMGVDPADWRKIRQVVLRLERFSERVELVVGLLSMHGFGRIEVEQLGDVQRSSDAGMVYALGRD